MILLGKLGSILLNDRGYFINEAALVAAYPTGSDGWFATVGDTDTIWIWDTGTSSWVNSGCTGFVPYTGATTDVDLGANNLTVNTDTLHVDSTNDRIGIGTTTPTERLHLLLDAGERFIIDDKTSGNRLFFLGESVGGEPRMYFLDASGTAQFAVFSEAISGVGGYITSGNFGIGTITPTAILHLAAGTATNPQIKFESSTLLTTPEAGSVEFANDRLYITNVGNQKSVDRTSDVITSTITVVNTTTETTLFTAPIPANSARVGNVLKIRSCGKLSTVSAADVCTIRFKIGGVTVATIDSPGKILTNECWDIEACSTIRATGTSASSAIRIKMMAEDNTSSYCEIGIFDDTSDLDITITAEWNNAKTGNSISIGQGWMEYKN